MIDFWKSIARTYSNLSVMRLEPARLWRWRRSGGSVLEGLRADVVARGDVIFGTRPHPFSRFACSLAGFALAAIPAIAIAQQAQVSTADSAADQLTQDQRPAPEGDVLAPKSLFQLYFAVKTAPGSGANGSIRTVTTDTFKLRADTRIDLAPDWQLALRGDLPFLAKNPLNSSNPNADYSLWRRRRRRPGGAHS